MTQQQLCIGKIALASDVDQALALAFGPWNSVPDWRNIFVGGTISLLDGGNCYYLIFAIHLQQFSFLFDFQRRQQQYLLYWYRPYRTIAFTITCQCASRALFYSTSRHPCLWLFCSLRRCKKVDSFNVHPLMPQIRYNNATWGYVSLFSAMACLTPQYFGQHHIIRALPSQNF